MPTTTSTLQSTFDAGAGVLRLTPAFVAMNFNQAGGRLHLHPDDWFPLGLQGGSVKERWLASTLAPRKGSDSGLSYVLLADNARISLPEAITMLGADLVGEEYLSKYNGFPVHAKFFDYFQPLFLHIHLGFDTAERVGQVGKPEAYYFPVQLNNHPGARPATYFGFSPDVTKDEVLARLRNWEKQDTHLLELSRAYRLQPGTGWYTPPGTLHAPGSLLTYEVQWNSTSGAVFENVASGEIIGMGGLRNACPPDKKDDFDYILSLLDWEVNTDPDYRKHYFRPPLAIPAETPNACESWIVYDNPYFSAKELMVMPGQTVTVRDSLPYGCVVVQGHGKIGPHPCEVPGLLRYGQPSADEFFVSQSAAQQGVTFTNHSPVEPLVVLKHFGPG